MIILLYGEDTYRLNKKLAEIIDEYRVQKKGLNFRVIDADVSSYEELVGELRQNSIFAEKKFVIVKNAFTNKAFKEKMIEGINKLPQKDSVVVVVQEGKILKTDRLLKRLREDAKTQEFTPLEGARLEVEEARVDVRGQARAAHAQDDGPPQPLAADRLREDAEVRQDRRRRRRRIEPAEAVPDPGVRLFPDGPITRPNAADDPFRLEIVEGPFEGRGQTSCIQQLESAGWLAHGASPLSHGGLYQQPGRGQRGLIIFRGFQKIGDRRAHP